MAWPDELRFGPHLPVRPIDGYLPLEDHGLIGDGMTCALVGRDGAISWLCAPRFDATAVFCRLLDARRGGAFTVAPEGLVSSSQAYVPDTGVLATEMRSQTGLVRVIDAMTFHPGADLVGGDRVAQGELVRRVEVIEGRVRLLVEVEPRGDVDARRLGDGWQLRLPSRPELDLRLGADRPLDGPRSVLELEAGDRAWLFLRWNGARERGHGVGLPEVLDQTVDAWRRWASHLSYDGPQEAMVRRSALTLKLLDHFENGAMVAAATSSLPEEIGGVRNWDYRFAWIRDAAFSVYALRRIGAENEARDFLRGTIDAIGREGGRPRVLYAIDGSRPGPEREDPELEGYRGSPPVRWGNDAVDQRQHDVLGEIIDCAYQWARRGNQISDHLWGRLRPLIEAARTEWQEPDQGPWEVRSHGRPFTYSAALCQVALDRGAWLAHKLDLPGDRDGWRRDAERLRETILERAWDPDRGTLTEQLGGGGLDASLLSLPLRRVIRADDPRMVATTEAIRRTLGTDDGLVYRYDPEQSPDGLPGREGAFLLCSFWLVDNLALQGRLDEAQQLYESLCDRANPLGLLSEQIDPDDGSFLGNFPQAFSHVGVISSGVTLSRALRGQRRDADLGAAW